MRFHSDDKEGARGFSIRASIYKSNCTHRIDASKESGVSSGVITTPNWPNQYPNDAVCVWEIDTKSDSTWVKLTFDQFDLVSKCTSCDDDYITLSQTGSLDTDSHRYCSTHGPSDPVWSKGSRLLIKFNSDCCFSSKGFRAKWEVVSEPPPAPADPIPLTPRSCRKHPQ